MKGFAEGVREEKKMLTCKKRVALYVGAAAVPEESLIASSMKSCLSPE